ncbi:MAG: phosphonate ABC transporter, permease protein PhnE, partial [Pseudomonadota bacterium]
FFQLGLDKAAESWNPDRASIFLLDLYAHKDHITRTARRPETIRIALEGDFRAVYQEPPAWYAFDQGTDAASVNFDGGGVMTIYPDRATVTWPGAPQTYEFRKYNNGKPYVVGFEASRAGLPDWIRWTETKIEARPHLYARMQFGRSRTEVHRFEFGWEHFWFDFDSPLKDYTLWQALGAIVSGDRVDPAQSNLSLAVTEFLDNEIWLHRDILMAMVETVLMALLGTMIASLVALPLAFSAARNVNPIGPVRFLLRRLFDLLRGVDTLIWSIVFLRAFGPGVFTGIFAIAFTDTGTLGKLMSEAIENADRKQREGMESTGAATVLQHRFGTLPQILPIFISQSLYYLESNTRGAVIIGALGAGGIGLKFIGAIQTGTNWEDVMYYSLLVLITVILMDTMSGWLRRALIGFDDDRKLRRDAQRARTMTGMFRSA